MDAVFDFFAEADDVPGVTQSLLMAGLDLDSDGTLKRWAAAPCRPSVPRHSCIEGNARTWAASNGEQTSSQRWRDGIF